VKRREFITLVGGAAVWPLAARAQQPGLPVIGFLHQGSPNQNVERVAIFRDGLRKAGFLEGQNIAIEFRWAEGRVETLKALAAELVQRQVAVIVTPFSTDGALAAKAATKTIPIVFETSADPVEIGLVASLNRPGGNTTGITSLNVELAPKRLELLRDVVPDARRYFALLNPTGNLAGGFTKALGAAAATLAIQIDVLRASTDPEIEAAFAAIPEKSGSVLVSGTDAFFFLRREKITALAARHGVPTIFDAPAYTKAGGLMSYGADDVDLMLLTASYTGRVLKGQQPADLPVMQPTKFVLTINLKTAKALGLNVPQALLATAEEIFE
jgi:putative ABC transport system substrate-binding protein